MKIDPVTLVGKQVELRPLQPDHVEALCKVGLHPELWTWIPSPVSNREDMQNYVLQALNEQKLGSSLPFVIVHRSTNEVVGCTRYANIERSHRRLEIGWSWVTPHYQRTTVNTESKYLLLEYAFEVLQVNRVELKTDALNMRSRNAILRMGATEEGTLRSHMVTSSGRVRDTVYFSVIGSEWPRVKARLQEKLNRT